MAAYNKLGLIIMLMLVKIGDSKYISDMYGREYLYFKSLKDFRSSEEDKTGRLDPRELNLKNKQIKSLTIQNSEKEVHMHKILKSFNAQYMENLSDSKINCCSLHWLEVEPGKSPSTHDPKIVGLGDQAILVYNWTEFYKILDNSLESLGYEYSRKKVIYYNPKTFDGNLTLHHKNEYYSWQNEYRILIAPTDNLPVNVPMPGLQKISSLVRTEALETVRLENNN
jgi:hypothetical protein